MTPFRTLLTALLLWPIFVFAQAVTLKTDRPLADYKAGQTANFQLTGAAGEYTYRIKYSLNTAPLEEGTLQHGGGTTTLSYKLDEPGFITCEVYGNAGGAQTGASFSMEDIPMYTDEPREFDSFWNDQKAMLAAVSPNIQSTRVANASNGNVDTYEWSAASVDGRRVYGYMSIPKSSAALPAVLQLPAFGYGPNLPGINGNADLAQKANAIAVTITIHNAPPNQRDAQAYSPDDITRRDGLYYRYAVLAAIRAVDVIQARPEYNRKDLCVWGDSQGGGLSFLVAGIDQRVTLMIQSIAALAQHGGEAVGKPSGFPEYLRTAKQQFPNQPSRVDQVLEATKYYDAGFAARRFKGPSLHYANYLDNICPPATVYAAFNELPNAKVMLHTLNLGHRNPPQLYQGGRVEFLKLHFSDAANARSANAGQAVGYDVDAGPFTNASINEDVQLQGRYSYDNATDASWKVEWDVLDGPGAVKFSNAGSITSTASFATQGTYRLRLRVTDPYPRNENQFYTLTDVVTVSVDNVVSTEEARANIGLAQFNVGPNPASGVLRVDGRLERSVDYTLELRDVTGRTVRTAAAKTSSTITEEWSVADLASGAYNLVLTTDKGNVTESIIVQ